MVAATTSAIVFAVLYVLGASTTVCSIAAFVAGAIPNWTLNRRWTWKVEGRVAFGREIVAYIVDLGLDAGRAVAGHRLDPRAGAGHPRRATASGCCS